MTGELDGWNAGGDEVSRLRISDADRHRVAEVLRQAAGEGRLEMRELDERLEAAYAAKTYADLVPITADLPGVAPRQQPAPRPATSSVPTVHYDSSIAILGSSTRRGVWEIGAQHTAFGLMGGVELDLREAVFSARETLITAYSIWAGIDIYVDAHTRVVVDGVGIMGSFEQGRDKVPADLGDGSPLVRVTGFALMGAVTVRRKGPRGELRRTMLGH